MGVLLLAARIANALNSIFRSIPRVKPYVVKVAAAVKAAALSVAAGIKALWRKLRPSKEK